MGNNDKEKSKNSKNIFHDIPVLVNNFFWSMIGFIVIKNFGNGNFFTYLLGIGAGLLWGIFIQKFFTNNK
ncbi:hypothetical protein [Clostridioides difficile]|uniref:Uncharacterized protein n=3 Tax=Clostridioides difficile TaxID=1496 RepID=A0AAX3GXM2_CLODI|nr:hypothetical protein [Clostridioides difficile]AVD41138.1 hypothetical protein C4E26_18545 [Clostridioides difficile]AVD44641.1 hypothetical protein C4E25_18555 [Clostridioides difficile]AXL65838.1 hypothetical protein C4E42_06065 [Clostridioides difficile]AXU67759.1 hypothetical protein CDIF29020_01437 [Clostridioides difficile]AXU89929.1 hypothetical protein CDIF29747_01394 [Clostridioides difficile]